MRRRRICRCSRRRRDLHRRIAVGLLVLVAQLLLAHAQIALQLLTLQQVVDRRPQQQHQSGLPGQISKGALVSEVADRARRHMRGAQQQLPIARQHGEAEIDSTAKTGISDFSSGQARRWRTSAPASSPGLSRSRLGGKASAEEDQAALRQAAAQPPSSQRKLSGASDPARRRRARSMPARASADRSPRGGRVQARRQQAAPASAASGGQLPRPATSSAGQGTSAADSSRLRATWPCSRAFCRRRGVACSVLSSARPWFRLSASAKCSQPLRPSEIAAREVALEKAAASRSAKAPSTRQPDHALHRNSQETAPATAAKPCPESPAPSRPSSVASSAGAAICTPTSQMPPAACSSCLVSSPVATAAPAGR